MNKRGRYLITGGTGFLGHHLIVRMIDDGFTNIIILARHEGELLKCKQNYPEIEIISGDVADPVICEKACDGVDGIFHLAAFKHIGLAEINTYQCIKSNVTGLINLLGQTLKSKPKDFIFISSDKATAVKSIYGATKLIGEKLLIEYSKFNPDTRYINIRYGNVWGSTGSFITKWIDAVEAGKEIIITDPDATRFFFTGEEAVDFIFDCIDKADSPIPMIPKLKGVKMGVILEAFQELYKCKVKRIGLQPGENMHETLDGKIYSNQVEQYTKDEIIDKFLKDDVAWSIPIE
jgi:UDP-N-acetylglucosamine 4,6-dehydratase/5-epimerase